MFLELKNKNKLIVSGCSFSCGVNLKNPEMNAYPYILSKKLNLQLINFSKGGIGNELIFSQLLDYFLENPEDKKNSLVLCQITGISRIEFYDDKEKELFFTLTSSSKDFIKLFFERYYNSEYYFTKFLRNLILLQSFFDQNNIDYIFFNIMPILYKEDKFLSNKKIKNLIKNINMDNYLWFYKKNPVVEIIEANKLPCNHPNEVGQDLIANLFYTEILKKYKNV